MPRALLALLVALAGCARDAPPPSLDHRSCGGVRFPVRTTLEGAPLALNGMAVRDATIFHVDVYVGAMYLETPTRDLPTFVESTQRKRLLLHFVHGVGREDVVRTLRWGFRSNTPEDQARYEADLAHLESFVPSVRDGDELGFDYVPARGLRMHVNGATRAELPDDGFARAFWNVFVGPRRSNQVLRDGLVGGVCND